MTYATEARRALVERLPKACEGTLVDLYSLLVLVKGAGVTMEDVHDAWAVWAGEGHRSAVPFDQLSPEVQELDRPWLDAIHAAASSPSGEGNRAVSDCVFCGIVAGVEPATIVHEWPDALAIVPRGGVVDGHLLVLPRVHVQDLTTDPVVTAAMMRRAAEVAKAPCNVITSAGREATQSVFHLHLHVVPRAVDDGLALPWYSGKRSRREREGAQP